MCSQKPTLLHLSADYPNPLRNRTTVAIQSLVEGAQAFNHIVISLKRTLNPFKAGITLCDSGHQNITLYAGFYFGFPFGFFLKKSMRQVTQNVLKKLHQDQHKVDLVHGHKFAFEGISAYEIAESLEIPLFVSIRGEADGKIVRFKPTYKALLCKIVQRSQRLYYVSAWFKPILRNLCDFDHHCEALLPNIVALPSPSIQNRVHSSHFITIIDLNVYRKKGLIDLLKAFARLRHTHPSLCLEIVGTGSARNIHRIKDLIHKLGLEENVFLLGKVPNKQLIDSLKRYVAFVMPSYNETFGMAYLEALFAGLPILYSQKTGIDGYLDDINVGYRVQTGNIEDIHKGLLALYEQHGDFKNKVQNAQGVLKKRFGTKYILKNYERDVFNVLKNFSSSQ